MKGDYDVIYALYCHTVPSKVSYWHKLGDNVRGLPHHKGAQWQCIETACDFKKGRAEITKNIIERFKENT